MFEEFAGTEIRCSFMDWDDARYYSQLLASAKETGTELYDILEWFRDIGTKLVRDQKYNFRLVPVIGREHWQNMDEYNRERRALFPYRKLLEKLLWEIRL